MLRSLLAALLPFELAHPVRQFSLRGARKDVMEKKSLERPDAEQQRRRRGQKRVVPLLVARVLRNRSTLLAHFWLALKIYRAIRDIFDGS
jgi:hypothetical protein